MKIFNILGDETQATILGSENRFIINMKEFPAGIYFVRISIDGQDFTRKIVKE